MNPSRKPRTTALLVHGMGGSPSWWNPLLPVLERASLAAIPLRLPSLEDAGPESWRDEVLAHIGKAPVVLIGHSLGAAVCLEAARLKPVEDLVMLACPPFLPDFKPEPPPGSGLSAAAIKRVGRFLRTACDHAPQISARSIHFVGASDRWVPIAQARRLPFPLIAIPGAGHSLNRSARLADQLLQHLCLWQKDPHK
jgi:pimeloyl-ACP methyl ester carboxylesterase